ncbi:unnamed protein product, partial [Symbiodinium sp. CCMP2592]
MLEVAKQAMEQAKRRKDLVKAMSSCNAGPKTIEEDDSKRSRASRTPSTIASTPSTKTPDPKAMKKARAIHNQLCDQTQMEVDDDLMELSTQITKDLSALSLQVEQDEEMKPQEMQASVPPPSADPSGPEKIQASVPPPSDPSGPEKIQGSVLPPGADPSGLEKIQASVPPPSADASGPEKIQASVPPPSADASGPEKIQASVPPPSADASGLEKIQASVPPPSADADVEMRSVDLADPSPKVPSSVHQALLRPGTVDMELLAAAIEIAKGGSEVPEQTGGISAINALEQALKNKMPRASPPEKLAMPHPQEKPDQEMIATTADPVAATTTVAPVPASDASSVSATDKAGYEARLDEIEKQLKARNVSDIVVW